LASALRGLAMTRMLLDGGDQARMEEHRPMVSGIDAASEVDLGAGEVTPDLVGHRLQGFQTLRQEPHSRVMDGSHGAGSADLPRVGRDRDDLRALRGCVPRIPDPLPPVLATVLVPSPCRTLRSRGCWSASCRTRAMHAGQSDPASAHVAKTVSTGVS
jgi:hypothetical protein